MDSYGHWVLHLLLLIELTCLVKANVVFQASHKYGGKAPLRQLLAHDTRRHGRSLAAVNFQIGGDGSPTNTALYYTKITIGNPPIEFHVQLDTGSDILWVNCKDCDNCPTETDLNIKLQQYDIKESSTGKIITCDQDFCSAVFQDGQSHNCKVGMDCEYAISYGDGSKTSGHFVRDNFVFDKVSGDFQTSTMNGSIAFGCSSRQSSETASSTDSVDGIVGLGQSNTSILSQLASSGKVRKIFSHCLDGKRGGGIFAIGAVAEPKFNTTPLVANQPHYNVALDSIEVGGTKINFPQGLFGFGPKRRAVIDSGTTLAYIPSDVYKHILQQMFSQQPDLKTYLVEEQFKCFLYDRNVDDGFPVVKFVFDESLSLTVYPHNYLFEVRDDEYCIGWQSSEMRSSDGQEMTLLGDMALSDKLIVYDLENQTVGWTQYDCTTSIKVTDEETGQVCSVAASDLQDSSSSMSVVNIAWLVLFVAAVSHLIE